MTIDGLLELVKSRTEENTDSYTGKLLQQGVHAIGKKLVEEAAESWMAARYETKDELTQELSQVVYYVVCMMVARGISLQEIYEKL